MNPQLNNASNALNNIDFGHIIGSPLKAAVEAQSLAAEATVRFITEVGFDRSNIEDNRMHQITRSSKTYYLPYSSLTDAEKGDNTNNKPKPLFITADNKVTEEKNTSGTDNKKYFIGPSTSNRTRYVEFNYEVQGEEDNMMSIRVPLLTIIPIPFLGIRTMDVHFTAKITGMYDSSSSQFSDQSHYSSYSSSSWSSGGLWGWIWGGGGHSSNSYSSTASYSSNRNDASASESNELTMDIKIHACNESMPSGLSRILGILENSISEKIKSDG